MKMIFAATIALMIFFAVIMLVYMYFLSVTTIQTFPPPEKYEAIFLGMGILAAIIARGRF